MRCCTTFLEYLTLIALSVGASAVPSAVEVEEVALQYVRASENYMSNSGFGEKVINISLGEATSLAVVEYQTRHVGMLQVIGHFVTYIEIDSVALAVIRSRTEEAYEIVEPAPPTNGTDPDEGEGSGADEDGYRLKISYTINSTREMIRENDAEEDLEEVVNMLDRAEDLLQRDEFEAAADMALRANEMVSQYLRGTDPGEPIPEEPASSDPGNEMPWLHGYIIVFDEEPAQDDWDRLESMFNATYMSDALDYVEYENAYWVRVYDTSIDTLKDLDGVKDVIALRGGPETSQENGAEVSEPLTVLVSVYGLLLCLSSLRGERGSTSSHEPPGLRNDGNPKLETFD